jgi:hypothetical protein
LLLYLLQACHLRFERPNLLIEAADSRLRDIGCLSIGGFHGTQISLDALICF